jgi:hypothetical protein
VTWIPVDGFAKGINKDIQADQLGPGLASDGSNVRFRDGAVEPFLGMQSVLVPAIAPYHVCHYTVGALKYLIYTGLQKTYRWDGSAAPTEITNGARTGAVDDRWCGFVFNGVYVQNNGVDVPQYYNGAGTLTDLTAWPGGYKAGFMRAFGPYIVAGDITRAGVRETDTFLWSSSTDPGTIPSTWNIADATKDAGDDPLSDTNGNLVDCKPLGQMNVIYKDDALWSQLPIQNNFIFQFARLPGDTGLLARGCVEEFPGGHVYLAPGFDVLVHSGQGPQSILKGSWRKWLASNMNSAFATRSFLVRNPATDEILICFPSGASSVCNKALVWNWKENTFGVRDLTNATYGSVGQLSIAEAGSTWATDSGTWASDDSAWGTDAYAANSPRIIFGATDPRLIQFDAGSDDFGANYTASVERTAIPLVDPTGRPVVEPGRRVLIRGIRPRIKAATGAVIKLQVGFADLKGKYPTWLDEVDYTADTSHEVNVFASGRYPAIRVFSSDGTPFQYYGCEIDVVPQGWH